MGLSFPALYSGIGFAAIEIHAVYPCRFHNVYPLSHLFGALFQKSFTAHSDLAGPNAHYVDSLADWEAVKNGPVMKYALELKAAGTAGPRRTGGTGSLSEPFPPGRGHR